jgi:porin
MRITSLLVSLLLVASAGDQALAQTSGAEAPPSSSAVESVEVPAGLTRLFGEYVRLPDPETSGYNFFALAWNDAFANTTGGRQRGGGVIGNLYVSLTVDTEKAGWWDNGKLVTEGIGVYGRQPSRVVGDYQYTSCIDAPQTIEPYQLYYQHSFFDDRLSLLAGVQDFSLEFAVADYGWGFVNSSFWTPPTVTQQWWSFYPTTGLATRAKLQLSESGYFMAGVYDGKPSDPTNLRKIDWALSKRDGAYSIAELGISETAEGKRPYKLALGGWYSSGEYIAADGTVMSANSGSYLLGQTMLYGEDGAFDRGLGAFAQLGQADSSRNFNSWHFGGGLRYKGLFDSRPEDVAGFGWARPQISGVYRGANPGFEAFEGAFELTYRAKIRPYITVQPSVQYIANPGANVELNDAVVLYLRSEIML